MVTIVVVVVFSAKHAVVWSEIELMIIAAENT